MRIVSPTGFVCLGISGGGDDTDFWIVLALVRVAVGNDLRSAAVW